MKTKRHVIPDWLRGEKPSLGDWLTVAGCVVMTPAALLLAAAVVCFIRGGC